MRKVEYGSVMEENLKSHLVESMRDYIVSGDAALNCLNSLPPEIAVSDISLLFEVQNSGAFLIIAKESILIASSDSQGINAGTLLKATVNLNPMSLVKNQGKLMKAGFNLATGSSGYSFKKHLRENVSNFLAVVETSTWKSNNVEFALAFVDRDSKVMAQLPITYKDSNSVMSVVSVVRKTLGHEFIESGEFVGHLDSEGAVAAILRKSSLEGVQPALVSAIDFWEKSVVVTNKNKTVSIYPISSDLKAELYEDGQLSVQYVANRAASASHGSIGLNLLSAAFSAPTHDKKKTDTRSVSIHLVSSTWQVQMSVSPTVVSKARALATRVNQIVGTLEVGHATSSHSVNPQDVSESLMKLVDLKNQGILTEEEFNKAKTKLLS
jgi:hypothetical protein